MPQVFTIREFGGFYIETDRPVQPDGHIGLPCDVFEKLERFVLENKGTDSDPLELMSIGSKPRIGKIITAKNYVGTIEFTDGTVIEILPKVAAHEEEERDRKIFMRMLQSVLDLPMKEFDLAKLATTKMGVLEPFIVMFTRAAGDLAKKGLKGAYLERESNEPFVKGKIDLIQNVRLNAAHRERFYVRYDEFGVNRPANRLIKTTLVFLRSKAHRVSTRRDIDLALTLFSDVDVSVDVDRDFAQYKLDRTMGPYVPLLRWCKVFLKGKSFTTFRGSEVAASLLFPMERLFEAYVAKEVRRATTGSGWRADIQVADKHLYDKPKEFRLQPDIMLKNNEAKVAVDTKWKRLDEGKPSRSDMYQMYAYQKRYRAKKAILVYPLWLDEEYGVKKTYFSWSADGTDAITEVFMFDLNRARESAEALMRVAAGDSDDLLKGRLGP